MNITLGQIKKGYNYLYKRALTFYKKAEYYKSIENIKKCAHLAYKFNWIYSDPKLESLIHDIVKLNLTNINIQEPRSKNVVWIDHWGYEKRGLTTQYLNALLKKGFKILFILTDKSNQDQANLNISKILKTDGCKVIVLESGLNNNLFKCIENISCEIYRFKPSKLFLHIAPWSIEALILADNINGIVKYNVNLTDHAFWLGVSFVNYNIEFRDYGYTISIEKRGFNKNQLIKLPYYPIFNNENPFEGFPFEIKKDDIIIFTGGSPYKYKGKDGIFFKLMDILLSIDCKVKILIAGFDKDSYIENGISNLKEKDRIFIIGSRKDIDKVFENIDIYLGSYPFGGGLMSCYAAILQKPILAYADKNDLGNQIESLVNIFGNSFKTTTSFEEFKEYATKLIKDDIFRRNEGLNLHATSMTEKKFNDILEIILNNNNSPLSLLKIRIDYKDFINLNLRRESLEPLRIIYFLYYLFRYKVFLFFPQIITFLPSIILKIIKNYYYKI